MLSCRIAWMTLLLFAGVALVQPGRAQETKRWEVMRVLVPESIVGSVLTDEFDLVETKELEALLRDEAKRRQSQGQSAGILEAFYFCRFDGEAISSERSRWKFSAGQVGTPIELGGVSVALRPASLGSSQAPSLLPNLRYFSDGRAFLSSSRAIEQAWFGFAVYAESGDALQKDFRLSLPAAVIGSMLLSVPNSLEVRSTGAPVVKLDNPGSVLPSDWPVDVPLPDEPHRSWYLVSISGLSQFDLSVRAAAAASRLQFDFQVRAAEAEYSIDRQGIQLRSEFLIGDSLPGGRLFLQADRSLRVRSVRVNGQLAPSTETFDASGQRRMIALQLPPATNQDTTIQVQSFAPSGLPWQSPLPTVNAFRGYVLNGRSALNSADGLEVEDLRVSGSKPALTIVPTAAGVREQSQWRWNWQGALPEATVRIGKPKPRWEATTFTKLAVHPAWVSAHSHLRLLIRKPETNQVKLRIGSEWFVDSVEVTHESSRVTFDVTPRPGGGNDLELRWEEADERVDMEIRISAHNPTKTDADAIRIPSAAFVVLPDADQRDTYVIEASGQFQLQVDPELLALRQTDDELPDWQRALLPRLSESWILRGSQGITPSLALRRTRGTFTAHHTTSLHSFSGGAQIRYRIACQPISGSISQLTVSMPAVASASNLVWSIVRSEKISDLHDATAINGIATSTTTETLYEIALPSALSHAFELEADVNLPAVDRDLFIPLPSVPRSVGQEGRIELPEDFTHNANASGLEVLPFGNQTFSRDLSDRAASASENFVAYRYDPNELSSLQVHAKSNEHRTAWGWHQRADHWFGRDATSWHEARWSFMVPQAQSVTLSLPAHWVVRAVEVDRKQILSLESRRLTNGLTAEPAIVPSPSSVAGMDNSVIVAGSMSTGDSQWIKIDLPRGDAVEVAIGCKAEQVTGNWLTRGWLNRVRVVQPTVSVDVLSREEHVWVPPSRVALASLFEPVRPGRLIERLYTVAWWRWLSPDPWTARFDAEEQAILPTSFESKGGPAQFGSTLRSQATREGNATAPFWSWTEIPKPISFAGTNFLSPKWTAEIDKFLFEWIIDRAAVGALALAGVLFLTLVLFAWLRRSILGWWIALVIVATATIVVPASILPWVQLVFLALISALMGRLGLQVASFAKSLSRQRRSPSRRDSTVSLKHVSVLAMATGSQLLMQSACAQTSGGFDDAKKTEIFSLLIPIQEDRQLSGDYVYVPNRLYRMLRDPLAQFDATNSPRIVDVLYSIQIASTSLERSTVSDFAIELDVEIGGPDTTFRFPIQSSEAHLLRGFVSGQELLVGSALRQEAGHVVWRAPATGRFKLRLHFVPKGVRQSDERGQLAMQIPPLATARLEVRAESIKDVQVNAIGPIRRESAIGLSADLGPTRQLNVSWPLRPGRRALYSVPQVFSDTWLHIQHEHVIAQCQLRITGADSLSPRLHVQCNADWEPVGGDWNDGIVLSSSEVAGANEHLYQLDRTNLASDTATIRVLMLPKSRAAPGSLSIPVLSLRESSSLTRTLAYSVLGRPGWMLSGTEKWQSLADIGQAIAYWSDAKLSEQPTMLRVPLGAISAGLIRQPTPPLPTVDETTEVRFRLPETTLKYEARWQASPDNPSALRLRVPVGSQVASFRVNNLPIRFSLVPDQDSNQLVAFQDVARGGLQELQLELKLPTPLNRPTPAPRVWLEDTSKATSAYRLLRGAELSCKLAFDPESAIDRGSFSSHTQPVLSDLEFVVGETDLSNLSQMTTALPLRATLTRSSANGKASSILRLVRLEDAWQAQLECSIDTPAEGLDYVLVDAPAELRDTFEIDTTYMTLPSAEPNRLTLCFVAPAPVNGKTRVAVKANLAGSSLSQSIKIPDLRLLNTVSPRPLLALPNEIDGEQVRWIKVGRSLSNRTDLNWFDERGYSMFENGSDLQQLSWRETRAHSDKPRVLWAKTELLIAQNQVPSATMEYWLEPRSRDYVTLTVPDSCEVFGAMLGFEVANWTRSGDDQIRILMRPSYLPVRLRLFVRWDKNLPSWRLPFQYGLALPLLNAETDSPALMSLRSSPRLALNSRVRSREITPTAALTRMADAWYDLIQGVTADGANRSIGELVPWLAQWNPNEFAISDIPPRLQAAPTGNAALEPVTQSETDQNGNLTASEIWLRSLDRLGISESSPWMKDLNGKSSASMSMTDGLRPRLFEVSETRSSADEPVFYVSPAKVQVPIAQPWIAAGTIVLVGLFGTLAGKQLGLNVLRFSELNPWLLWFGFATVAWWWLPVAWPSCVMAICAVYVLLHGFASGARRLRFF